jgi:hypothetical protein
VWSGETHINKIIKGEEGKGDYKELLRMRRLGSRHNAIM